MTKKIIIIGGDPNSINSEIIFKSWKNLSNSQKRKIYLISNFRLIKQQFKSLKAPIKIEKVDSINNASKSKKLKILNIQLDYKYKKEFAVPFKSSSKFVLDSLNLAHKIALCKNVKGIINCPINKKLLKTKNFGVTEFFASKCKIRDKSEVMLIRNKNLSVSPITTHIDIKKISKNIRSSVIFNKIKTINYWFSKLFLKKPKIAILGLNPHNSELKENSEERKIIIPTINKLKKININVKGPLIADTIFIHDYKNYDVIVGMYHDQVLAPFKTLFKFNAVNVTLGLKYLRVSPDHGTATSLIKKRKADPTSLIECIKFIEKFGK